MANIPKDFMDRDEIEVGLTSKDVGINAVNSEPSNKLPPGF